MASHHNIYQTCFTLIILHGQHEVSCFQPFQRLGWRGDQGPLLLWPLKCGGSCHFILDRCLQCLLINHFWRLICFPPIFKTPWVVCFYPMCGLCSSNSFSYFITTLYFILLSINCCCNLYSFFLFIFYVPYA